jgi:hypothetical protein
VHGGGVVLAVDWETFGVEGDMYGVEDDKANTSACSPSSGSSLSDENHRLERRRHWASRPTIIISYRTLSRR